MKQDLTPLLRNWIALQRYLRGIRQSKQLLPLLQLAVQQRTRLRVTARIFARFNKLRVAEELKLLEDGKLPTYLR